MKVLHEENELSIQNRAEDHEGNKFGVSVRITLRNAVSDQLNDRMSSRTKQLFIDSTHALATPSERKKIGEEDGPWGPADLFGEAPSVGEDLLCRGTGWSFGVWRGQARKRVKNDGFPLLPVPVADRAVLRW